MSPHKSVHRTTPSHWIKSSSQSWKLSQSANKSNGQCSVCLATRQLHLKDGTIHRHGPRDHPCPGSDKPHWSLVCELSTSSSLASAQESSPISLDTPTQAPTV